MKRKLSFALAIALVGISYTTQDTSASVINSSDDFYSKVKIYDGNGVEESYSIEELKMRLL